MHHFYDGIRNNENVMANDGILAINIEMILNIYC